MNLSIVCWILALVCFVLAAAGVSFGRINLLALGAALAVLGVLVTGEIRTP